MPANGKLSPDEADARCRFASAANALRSDLLFVPFGNGREVFVLSRTAMKTKRLTIDAMLSAMCAVLGYVAIDMGAIKITFESFPVLLGALMFGPADGAVIGCLGTLVYQLLRYGVSATTLLWMLPYIIMGFLCGLYAKKKSYRMSVRQTVVITVISGLLVTLMNTGVIYLDSRLYGYYYPGIVAVMLVPRILTSIGESAVFGLALPPVMKSVRKVI